METWWLEVLEVMSASQVCVATTLQYAGRISTGMEAHGG